MAKLRCSRELIEDLLFGKSDVVEKVRIVGAGFDSARGELVLDIVGEPVPNSPYVECTIRVVSKAPLHRVRFTAAP